MLTYLSDSELVAQCQRGDVEAFGLLFARYDRTVYRYAYHMLGNADEADDVKQDTFLKAYRNLPGFRGQCSLTTWLLKITSNLCLDRLKSRSRRSELPLAPEMDFRDEGPTGMNPADIAERKDLYATLQKVLRALPEPQRRLIVLRDVEGLSYQEIAELLDCSVASVKLRLFRARRGFRDRVDSILRIR